MKVGAAGDRFEREADRIADHVVGPSALPAAAPPPIISPLAVQRMPLDEAEPGPEEPAQRQAETAEEEPVQRESQAEGQEEEAVQRAMQGGPEEESVQRETQAEGQEEESVQRETQAGGPDKESVQRETQAGGQEEETLQQMRATGPEARKEEEPVQRMRATGPEAPSGEGEDLTEMLTAQREAGPGAAGGAAPAGVEAAIGRMRGGAAPGLDEGTRDTMEGRMGVDLSGVRVHTGEGAARAADSLNAKAFTVGQDMFFGRGQYDPVSTAGRRLIAHETAHTVQQQGGSSGVQRIQRAEDPAKAAEDKAKAPLTEVTLGKARIDLATVGKMPGTFVIPRLMVPVVDGVGKGFASGTKFQPAAKSGAGLTETDFKLSPPGKRPSKNASDVWSEHAKAAFAGAAKTRLKTLTEKPGVEELSGAGDQKIFAVYVKKGKVGADAIMLGTLDQLSTHDNILRPQYGQNGVPNPMQADHILEWQLGGSYEADNMQMLLAKFNMQVGRETDQDIIAAIKDVLDDLKKFESRKENKDVKFAKPIPDDPRVVKENWQLHFKEVKKKKKPSTGIYWSRDQIKKGEQVDQLKAMTAKEMIEFGFKPSTKGGAARLRFINVFPDLTGGKVAQFKVEGKGDKQKLKPPGFFYKGIFIKEITDFKSPAEGHTNQVIAKLLVSHNLSKKKKKKFGFRAIDVPLNLNHHESLGYGSYIKREDITTAYENALSAKAMSPIRLVGTRIDPGGTLVAEGEIIAAKALLPGLKVPLRLMGDEIFIDFPIPSKNLKFGPLKVSDPSLRVGVSDGNLFLAGQAGIGIDKVGSGTVFAKATREDIEIGGKFAFDFDFVENAELDAKYSLKTDAFSISGTLTAKKGTLPGVESGTIKVDVTNDTFGMTGTLMLGGVLKGASITVGYAPETGLLIEGKDIPLPVDKLPGVSDAKITVRALRNPEGGWKISGAGSAALKAPGASGSLDVTLNGEAVRFSGRVDLAKGPATGFIQITATNMAMDEAGNPVEGGPVGELQIWGKGQASIAFGKVLTGTAAIEYTRDGRIIITGEIALPPTVDLFKRVDYNKRLVEIAPPDFPIWGVKLGPVGFGIFAFVDAKVDFLAYVGPGQLRDTKVKATMDLDKPAEAQVEGKAQFHVPAFAGFRLDLGGGLKAQVAVAYVKGRVGLDGTLGLGAEAKIDVGVKWNAAEGFAAEALAEVKASPKFELGVNASVTAGVSLPWPLSDITKTWGPWRKKLGEFGPNMELSAKFPVKYTEKDGLDLDLNKIQVTKPNLDAKALMKSAFDTLV